MFYETRDLHFNTANGRGDVTTPLLTMGRISKTQTDTSGETASTNGSRGPLGNSAVKTGKR